jgi:hypothetical protein
MKEICKTMQQYNLFILKPHNSVYISIQNRASNTLQKNLAYTLDGGSIK